MILLSAVAAGLVAGLVRAWHGGRQWQPLYLRLTWLVPVALAPQLLAFYVSPTRHLASDNLAAVALVGSQMLLLTFAWLNRHQPGFRVLGLGLALNFLVITLNGGLMPISPERVAHLAPNARAGSWQVGSRLGTGKDIVLPITTTHLWWLSDCLLLPTWFPHRVAYSPGDVLIAGGAFWLLWTLGGAEHMPTRNPNEQETTVSCGHFVTPQLLEPAHHGGGGGSRLSQAATQLPENSVRSRLQRRTISPNSRGARVDTFDPRHIFGGLRRSTSQSYREYRDRYRTRVIAASTQSWQLRS